VRRPLKAFMTGQANDGILTIDSKDDNDAGDYTIEVTAELDNRLITAPQRVTDTSAPVALYDSANLPLNLVYRQTFLIKANVGANPSFVKTGNTAPTMTPKPTTIYFKATNSLGIIPLPTPTDVDGDPIDVRIDVAPGLMTDGTNIMTFGTFAIRDSAYDVKITLTDTPENTDDTLTTVYDV
jgi:hypothetical protein